MIRILLLVFCLCSGCVVSPKKAYINVEGTVLQERILPLEGYYREKSKGLGEFVRNYPVYEDDYPIHLYNGEKKVQQGNHVAVFKLPLESYDLQQCADSIMRMYAEYYYHTGQYEQIGFHFVNGFFAEYARWRQGDSIVVKGNNVKWIHSDKNHTSYESFQEYLKIVFSYASTISLEYESQSIDINDIQIGDIFLKSGSPGHVVMVVDVCVNKQGKKAFLLAQGFMPAQQFHVLKNTNDSPWYLEEDVVYPFKTPEYTFEKGSLRRLVW